MTTQSSPAMTEQKPFPCAAFGCLMHGSVKHGGDWVCSCHAHVAVSQWQSVTQRMHQRRAIINAIDRAVTIHPFDWFSGRAEAAGSAMRSIGRPDLVPMKVSRSHKVFDRHDRTFAEHVVERDEADHLPLWLERLRLTLIAECTEGLEGEKVRVVPEPKLPLDIPPVQSLIPEFSR